MERSHRSEISDIVARIDLATLLDELATPAASHSARGRRWHCPITGHDDEHPSVTMYTDSHGHQRWRCWSGAEDHRGDAVDLVVAVHNLSPGDAIDWLADRIGPTPTAAPPRPSRTSARQLTGRARPGGRLLRAALRPAAVDRQRGADTPLAVRARLVRRRAAPQPDRSRPRTPRPSPPTRPTRR